MPSNPIHLVTISGAPVLLDDSSFSILETLNGPSSMRGAVRSEDGTYRVPVEKEVIVTENGTRIFGGTISKVVERGLVDQGSHAIINEFEAVDFSELATRNNVDAVIPKGTLKSMLQALVPYLSQFGVTLDPSQVNGPNVDIDLVGDNRTVAELLNDLAGLTQFYWQIDYFKVLRMQAPGTTSAPFNVVTGDGNQDGDVQVEHPQVAGRANRIVVRYGEPGLVLKRDTFVGDGVTDTYTLTYQIDGHVPGSNLGSVGYGYLDFGAGTESIASPPFAPPYLWEYTHATRQIRRVSGPVPAGVVVSIPYDVQFPQTVVVEDAADIAANGLRTKTIDAPTLYDKTAATTLANNYLQQYLGTPTVVRYLTSSLGIRPGMQQTIDIAVRAINDVFTVVEVRTHIAMGKSIAVKRHVTAVRGLLFRSSPATGIAAGTLSTGSISGECCSDCPAPPVYSAQYHNDNPTGQCGGAYHILYGPLFWSQPDSFLGEVKTSGWIFVSNQNKGPSGFIGLADPNRLEVGMIGDDFSMDLFGPTISQSGLTGFKANSILMNSPGDIVLTAGAHQPTPSGFWGVISLVGHQSIVKQDLLLSGRQGGVELEAGDIGDSYIRLNGLNIIEGLAGLYRTVTSLPHTINVTPTDHQNEFFGWFIKGGGSGTVFMPWHGSAGTPNLRVFPDTAVGRILFVKNSQPSGNVVTLDFGTAGSNIDGASTLTLPGLASVIIGRHDDGWKKLASDGITTGSGGGTPGGNVKNVQFHNPSGVFDGDDQLNWHFDRGQLRVTAINPYSQFVVDNPFVNGGGNGGIVGFNLFTNYAEQNFGYEYFNSQHVLKNPNPGLVWWSGGGPGGSAVSGMGMEYYIDPGPSGTVMGFNRGFGFETKIESGFPAGFMQVYEFGSPTGATPGPGIKIRRLGAFGGGGNGAASWLGLEDRLGGDYYLWVDVSGVPRLGTAPPEEDGTPSDFSGIPLISGGVAATSLTRQFGITIDGGGAAITTGQKGYWRAPVGGTITRVTVLADVTGSVVLDVWKDTYANYPPTVADTITASAKPTLSSAIKSEDTTLTGWTKTFNAGDTFGFNVDSASTVTRVHLLIDYTPTG